MNNLQTVLHTKEARTTSINVAFLFEKKHTHVMRDIRKLIENEQRLQECNGSKFGSIKKPQDMEDGAKLRRPNSALGDCPKLDSPNSASGHKQKADTTSHFASKNFFLVDYVDKRGRPKPMYEMNRDGFLMLALGFTGDEAYRLKEVIINRFNNMESAIRVANQLGTDRMLYLTKGNDFVLRDGKFIDPNDLMVLR